MTPAGEPPVPRGGAPKETLLAELEEERRAAGIDVTVGAHRADRAQGRTARAPARRTATSTRGAASHRRDRPQRQPPPARRPRRGPRQGLQPPLRPEGLRGQARARRRRRRLGARDGDRARRRGAHVTLSYRRKESRAPQARERREVLEAARSREHRGSLTLAPRHAGRARSSRDAGGPPRRADVLGSGRRRLANDVVFTMLGREAPLDFFRRSGIPIRGEWTAGRGRGFAAFLLFCVFLYNWKAGGALNARASRSTTGSRSTCRRLRRRVLAAHAAPGDAPRCSAARIPASTTRSPTASACFSSAIRRIRRRRTPYVTRQTLTLTPIQWIPLFLLPYLVLPWLGHDGRVRLRASARAFADHLFPVPTPRHGREYWRAFGFILAWPLFIWNVFSSKPMWCVARDLLRPDVRAHPAHHPALGQGRLLRLDLLVRRARGDDGRHAPRRRCRTARSGTA